MTSLKLKTLKVYSREVEDVRGTFCSFDSPDIEAYVNTLKVKFGKEFIEDVMLNNTLDCGSIFVNDDNRVGISFNFDDVLKVKV